MANRGEVTQVRPITQRPILLDEMLRPMWKCLRYSGIHHRFLSPMEERRRFYLFRCVSTVLIVFLLLIFDSIYFRDLYASLLNKERLTDIFRNVVGAVNGFTITIFVYQFYTNHQQLVEFYKDWNQVEMQFSRTNRTNRTNRIVTIYYLSFYTIVTFSCVSSFIHILVLPDSPFSLIRFAWAFIFSFNSYITVILIFLREMLPAFFYYQAGCAIENLELQLQNCIVPFNNHHSTHLIDGNPYHGIWKRYETIKGLVDRANQLFGVTVVTNQLSYICMTCLIIYIIVFPNDEGSYDFTHIVTFILAVLRIFWVNWVMSQVYLSCEKLGNSVASVLSQQWHLDSGDNRVMLTSFLLRLNNENVAACPLNLYNIDPSNLLTLFTLHASYIIFLLQIHD